MALQTNYNFKGVNITESYSTIWLRDKKKKTVITPATEETPESSNTDYYADVIVEIFASKEARDLNNNCIERLKYGDVLVGLDGDIAKAYEYIKTKDIFSEAIDV